MNYSIKAYGYAVLATLCWSTVASAFKLTLRYFNHDVFTMLFYSVLFSLILLFLMVIIQRKGHLLYTISRKEILSSLLFGFINPFLYYIILFKAYSLLPGQEALSLNYTWPIMLTVLSVPLLHQKIQRLQILGILISFGGVLTITTRGQFENFNLAHFPGILLALGSAVLWALYWIFNLRDQREAIVKLLINFCFGFLYITVYLCVTQGIVFPSWKGLLGTFWIGLFEMGITFVIWIKALEMASATSLVSNIVYLSPFISLLFLKMVVGEKLFYSSIIGLVLIVMGLFIQILQKTKVIQNRQKL